MSSNFQRFRTNKLVFVGTVTAILGLAAGLYTLAAVANVDIEPELGALSGGVTQVSDVTASGGKAIKFAGIAQPTLPTPPVGMHWEPSFTDDFSGTSLDASKWSPCYSYYDRQYDGCTLSGNNELEWYKPSQVSVTNGALHLKAEKKTVTGEGGKTFDYVSGAVSTADIDNGGAKWTGNHGYYEARIKIPSGKGLWPAWWMFPIENWPPEIDIMEILGHEPNVVYMTYHFPNLSEGGDGTPWTGPDFSADWHTFAVNWQSGRIDWYIDGVLRKTYTGDKVSDQSMHLLLNLAVGGDWPGSPDGNTAFPATMDVDYVHAYTLVAN